MAKKSTQSSKAAISVISRDEFQQQYNLHRPFYERLATNLREALKTFLSEKEVPYLDVLSRIKDADSAYEKITRKGYESPFEEIEDWSGLRIICYYPDDVAEICRILEEEFNVQTQEDTATRLAPHEFGYRSTHLILTVKKDWMSTPNYRGLQGFKAEVQVRTILMHAWAEIEHKLQYKSTEQVPEQFQRKLYRLSAKFEEADEQFDELRKGIADYRATLREAGTSPLAFRTQELNLDTLQAFLDTTYPDREKSGKWVESLFDEIVKSNINMSEIVDAFEFAKDGLPVMEKIWFSDSSIDDPALAQAGAMRALLDIGNKKFHKQNKHLRIDSLWNEGIQAALEHLKSPNLHKDLIAND